MSEVISTYAGNIPAEYVDKLHIMTEEAAQLPWGATEAMNGRIAGLAIGSASSERKAAILPDNERFHEFVTGMRTILNELNLSSPDVYWAPDATAAGHFSTEQAILDQLEDFAAQLDPSAKYVMYPNRNAGDFPQITKGLNTRGFIAVDGLPYYDYSTEGNPLNRSGWARNVNSPDVLSFAEEHDIPYPPAMTASSQDGVEEAYQRVIEANQNSAVFMKRIHSSNGEVYPVSTQEEAVTVYNRIASEGRLRVQGVEEPVELQGAVDIVTNLSYQYDEDRIVTPGGVTQQLFNPDKASSWSGNKWNARIPELTVEQQTHVEDEVAQIARKVGNGLLGAVGAGNVGRGGIDLAVTRQEEALGLTIIEHNGGRFTGADPANALAETLRVADQPFLLTKIPGKPACDVKEAFDTLQAMDLSFDTHKGRGVLPMLWLRHSPEAADSGAAYLFMTGHTEHELDGMLADTLQLLEKEGYIHHE